MASARVPALSPLRVTVVTPFGTSGGGAELWLCDMLEHTTALDVRAILMAEGPLADRLRDLGARVRVVPTGPEPRDVIATSLALRAELRRYRPSVVVGNGVKAQLALTPAAKSLGLPTVWVKHDHSFDASLATILGRTSTTVVATALEVGLPTGRDDLVVLEPPRPPDPMDRDTALARLAHLGYTPDDRPCLVMVGRLVPYKGVDVAIRALAYGPAHGWRLVVIGAAASDSPREDSRLADMAHDLGVADRVTFLGAVPNAGRLLPAFDALAVLTRPGQAGAPQREGYGISGTEAMLAGLPAIAAGAGPLARRLAGTTPPAGVEVRPGDPLDTARALDLLRDAARRRAMGAAGREAAARYPDATEVASGFVEVLAATAGKVPAWSRR